MPNFRREIPRKVVPVDPYDDDYTEDDREIDAMYPEWSGVMQTTMCNPIFYHEDGEER